MGKWSRAICQLHLLIKFTKVDRLQEKETSLLRWLEWLSQKFCLNSHWDVSHHFAIVRLFQGIWQKLMCLTLFLGNDFAELNHVPKWIRIFMTEICSIKSLNVETNVFYYMQSSVLFYGTWPKRKFLENRE